LVTDGLWKLFATFLKIWRAYERLNDNQLNCIPGCVSHMDNLEARMSGKGDKPRPMKDRKKFEENFDRIFNKRKEKKNESIQNKRPSTD